MEPLAPVDARRVLDLILQLAGDDSSYGRTYPTFPWAHKLHQQLAMGQFNEHLASDV